MKHRMERLVVLPFTASCVSSSSVSVCIQHGRQPKEDVSSSHTGCRSRGSPKDPAEESSDHTPKSSPRFLAMSKPNIYVGLHRLTRTIKSLSQSLVFKEDMDEAEMEMEIGLPTDVKHVTHIGLDGCANPSADYHDNFIVTDLLSLCPISMAQFEQRATTSATHDMQNIYHVTPDVPEKS